VACGILDSLRLGTEEQAAGKMQTTIRQIDDVAIVSVSGRITLGEGNVMLREMVRELMDKGSKKILLNLGEVEYVDSSGVGELVRTYTTVRNQGGEFKLVNLSQRVNDLLQMTRLCAVFDIEKDEASALKSLGGPSQAAA
jgi:anti-sigma B factor antagonist